MSEFGATDTPEENRKQIINGLQRQIDKLVPELISAKKEIKERERERREQQLVITNLHARTMHDFVDVTFIKFLIAAAGILVPFLFVWVLGLVAVGQKIMEVFSG